MQRCAMVGLRSVEPDVAEWHADLSHVLSEAVKYQLSAQSGHCTGLWSDRTPLLANSLAIYLDLLIGVNPTSGH